MTSPDQNRPQAGQPQIMQDGLIRILAPNPSPMTYWGTNTYLLGQDRIAVIDPGPDDDAHLAAILNAGADRISHIVLTHSHLDHSALVPRLKAATGATVVAFGDSREGRREDIAALAGIGGGEGIDHHFAPDQILGDDAVLDGGEWDLRAIWTPGHIGNHICLEWGDRMFTGDHVMGWATSMVSPPDGDLAAFMGSLDKLLGRGTSLYYPAHGDPVQNPEKRVRHLITHRRGREAQIIEALKAQSGTPSELATRIYTDVPDALLPAATRNVLAHLIDLYDRNIVSVDREIGLDGHFSIK